MKTTSKQPKTTALIPAELIKQSILLIRGQKVMLDETLAQLYGVETKVLNQAVKRNRDRFPRDFMFRLNKEEWDILRYHFEISKPEFLRSQIVTSKTESLRSQIATSKLKGGGRRYTPYVFTEQGVAMLSSVLRSERAVKVNIEIMRTFVHLRQMLISHEQLSRKLESLEKKYDKRFKIIFDVLRELMKPPEIKPKPMGFQDRGRN